MFQSLRLMRCTRHSIRRQDGAMHQTLNSKAGNVRCIRQSQCSTRWCDAPDTQLEDKMVRCTILFQFATRWCDALDSQFSQRCCDALDSLTWKITQDKMVRCTRQSQFNAPGSNNIWAIPRAPGMPKSDSACQSLFTRGLE